MGRGSSQRGDIVSPKRRRQASKALGEPQPVEQLSPAQRMQAFKKDQRIQRSMRYAWCETLGFQADDFQIEAMDALEAGQSVLVAAPTGAGKTVVGEFATYLALQKGKRSFYTTPIKALSNQKFSDLRRRFGEDNVGLLTGDTSINSHASIVVMTTEVLRNMIYAGADLADLDSVVLDEVHYLADRFRGPVWEEVIIHLPAEQKIVALSATVSNAEEFGTWIGHVRGGCRVVVSEHRPVPLYQHMMVGRHLYDLYSPSKKGESTRINPELRSAIGPSIPGRTGRGGRNWHETARVRPPRESRPSTLIELDRAGLLPTITFVFSRAGCEDAVTQVVHAGIWLTNKEEQTQIAAVVDEVKTQVGAQDCHVLGINAWGDALERGIAAHHAGLLPIQKETVEKLFTRGLIKMVYATETLALGINMPARSVVIESLRKWNGAAHVQLTPGEYTQLSGRAGRRGIDTEGHAIVLHCGQVAPEEVNALASKRTCPLISAFTPTYNMVVNLLHHSSRAATRDVLETSFAQFQADGGVVELAQHARALARQLAKFEQDMACDRGDAREYFALRDDLVLAQKSESKLRAAEKRSANRVALATCQPGTIIRYGSGRRSLYAVVAFHSDTAIGHVSTTLIGTDGKFHSLSAKDVSSSFAVVGSMKIAGGSALRRNKERMKIADELKRRIRAKSIEIPLDTPDFDATKSAQIEKQLKAHPVHQCPEREHHARAGHQWARINRELRTVNERIDSRTHSVAHKFDRVCQVLEELGFLDGDTVTDQGERLRHIFGERDIIVMECLRSGAWSGLDDAELAAIVSTCVFESRREDGARPAIPVGLSKNLTRALKATLHASAKVADVEKRAGLEPTTEPDSGMMEACLAWAHGASLGTSLDGEEMLGGDFVRWIRQVMDLLDQLRHDTDEAMASQAKRARHQLVHGVVAWSVL